jgi:hypothetical protein
MGFGEYRGDWWAVAEDRSQPALDSFDGVRKWRFHRGEGGKGYVVKARFGGSRLGWKGLHDGDTEDDPARR